MKMKLVTMEEGQEQHAPRPGRYRVLWNPGGRTVYVKDAEFFEEQGGLMARWGKRWIEVTANSIEEARQAGVELGEKANWR